MGFSNENVYGFATYVEGVDKKFVPRLPDEHLR